MKRILTGAVLIAGVAALLYFDIPWLITAFAALVAVLAGLEFRDIAATRSDTQAGAPYPRWWVVFATLGFFMVAALRPLEPLTAASFLTLLLFVCVVDRLPLTQALPATAAGAFSLLYIAFPLSLIPRILAVEEGTVLLLFLFLCVWCGDIAALYVGRSFGKTKLSPALSPNKTWEGAIASVLASIGFGMGLIAFGNWLALRGPGYTRLATVEPWWQFLILAILLNIAAQMGDLAESALKRGVGVKDSGTLLPGHGGILDRIDALLFAAPLLWYILVLHDGL